MLKNAKAGLVAAVLVGTCPGCGLSLGPTTETVNVTADTRTYTTTSVAVDPTNGRHMAVAAVRWESFTIGELEYGVTAHVSHDWGRTWSETQPLKIDGQTNSDFPFVMYSPEGVLYLSQAANVGGERGSRIVVHKSSDKGLTWGPPTVIETLVSELPSMTADQSGTVYVVATGRAADPLLGIMDPSGTNAITISRSTDGGASFSTTGVAFDSDEAIGAMTLNVFEDGDMWLPFVNFIISEPVDESYIYGIASLDDPISLAETSPIAVLPRRTPFISNNAVGANPNGGERLYLTYLSGVEDSLRTAVTFSDDRGGTWSDPLYLEASNGGHYSRLPRVAVSNSGAVGVAWLQVDPGNDTCWNAYLAQSIDGGETFGQPILMSDRASCPNSADIAAIGGGLLSRAGPFGGHYLGLSATGRGFQAAWVDLSSGGFQVFAKHVLAPEGELAEPPIRPADAS